MKTSSVADILAQNEFVKGMSAEHIEFLAGCGSFVHFDKGKFVMLAGDPCTHFHLVRSGHAVVEIETGNKVQVIHSPGPGNLIGWSWVLPPGNCRYDVRVVEDMTTIAFDANCVLNKCEQDYEFGFYVYRHILQLVIERLMATRIQVLDMYA